MDGLEMVHPSKRVHWSERFSHEARNKPIPSLQSMVSKYGSVPGIIGMHGGLPPADAFPFAAFDCKLSAPCNSNGSSGGSGSRKRHADAAAAPAAAGESRQLDIADPALVAAAQQYNFHVKGYPPLQAWARDFIYKSQQPATLKTPSSSNGNSINGNSSNSNQEPIGCEVIITSGSSSALDALSRVLLNPGDPVLLEEYTYSHVVEALLLPLGCELLPLHLDHEGLIPSHLDSLLSARAAAGLALPRVLYTIPTGQNPTGSVMSQQRMAEVYRLAQKWDLVVIEDDAYYWLQYQEGPDNVPGLDLKPGFLSLDVDGRVIRLDTLAKLLGPGFRLGWLAAPPEIALKVGLYLASSTVGAPTLSQVMIHQLLDKWGVEGLESFVRGLQKRYAHYAAVAAAAAEEHLDGLVEWTPAKAGMFMWMKMLGDRSDSAKLLEFGSAEKVMIVPGHLASVPHLAAAAKELKQQQHHHQENGLQEHPQQNGSIHHQQQDHLEEQKEQKIQAVKTVADEGNTCPYFRVSFASVQSEDALREGFARLGRALQQCRDATNQA